MPQTRPQRAAHVVLFLTRVTAALSVMVVVSLLLLKYTNLGTAFRRPPGYVLGDRIDLPPEMYRAGTPALVIFASKECKACQASVEPLRHLFDALSPHRGKYRTILIAVKTPSGDDVGFEAQCDDVYRLRELELLRLKVESVPTLLWVDRGGVVKFAHTGLLSESNITAISDKVAALAKAGEGS